jgi:hypothetical protein
LPDLTRAGVPLTDATNLHVASSATSAVVGRVVVGTADLEYRVS